MKRFAALYAALDATTSTHDKRDALVDYFRQADAADAAWAAYFLAGGKPRQVVPTRLLRDTARHLAGLPEWLFDESYQAVGDLAETIAHILPEPTRDTDLGLAAWIENRLAPLRGLDPTTLQATLADYWDQLDWAGRFLLTKLIGGGFRVGVSRQLVVRALAEVAAIDHKRIAHRMVGWTDSRRTPTAERFARLIALDSPTEPTDPPDLPNPPTLLELPGDPAAPTHAEAAADADAAGLPYPFFLAHALQAPAESLGRRDAWLAEWKWDGIRAQLVKRHDAVWIWSRGEDLITERFPEIVALGMALPNGTVLDGEILAWEPGADGPLPFARLQPRITRKTLSRKILAESPACFMAYDLLESQGHDIRTTPQHERRRQLGPVVAEAEVKTLAAAAAALIAVANARPMAKPVVDAETPSGAAQPTLRLSPVLDAADWQTLATLRAASRARGVEGLMLKHVDAHYGVGRTKASGTWLKWKIDPYTVDAVLVYAQHGHGRRASLYTDYTFAVWSTDSEGARALVPFAKAYSGLTDEEIRGVDAVIRKTTVEKFGPVRSVTPTLVFEIAFEGIQASPRHKSGIAVRFPRILRQRLDKHVDDADTIQVLRALLDLPETAP